MDERALIGVILGEEIEHLRHDLDRAYQVINAALSWWDTARPTTPTSTLPIWVVDGRAFLADPCPAPSIKGE